LALIQRSGDLVRDPSTWPHLTRPVRDAAGDSAISWIKSPHATVG
jgi:hypothetical protein